MLRPHVTHEIFLIFYLLLMSCIVYEWEGETQFCILQSLDLLGPVCFKYLGEGLLMGSSIAIVCTMPYRYFLPGSR